MLWPLIALEARARVEGWTNSLFSQKYNSLKAALMSPAKTIGEERAILDLFAHSEIAKRVVLYQESFEGANLGEFLALQTWCVQIDGWKTCRRYELPQDISKRFFTSVRVCQDAVDTIDKPASDWASVPLNAVLENPETLAKYFYETKVLQSVPLPIATKIARSLLQIGKLHKLFVDPLLKVSVELFRRSTDGIDEFIQRIIENEQVTVFQFRNLAKRYRICLASYPTVERSAYIWFTSFDETQSNSEIYRLHVHTIDGKELDKIDFEYVAYQINVPFVMSYMNTIKWENIH